MPNCTAPQTATPEPVHAPLDGFSYQDTITVQGVPLDIYVDLEADTEDGYRIGAICPAGTRTNLYDLIDGGIKAIEGELYWETFRANHTGLPLAKGFKENFMQRWAA